LAYGSFVLSLVKHERLQPCEETLWRGVSPCPRVTSGTIHILLVRKLLLRLFRLVLYATFERLLAPFTPPPDFFLSFPMHCLFTPSPYLLK
jgi:hypothetical protein